MARDRAPAAERVPSRPVAIFGVSYSVEEFSPVTGHPRLKKVPARRVTVIGVSQSLRPGQPAASAPAPRTLATGDGDVDHAVVYGSKVAFLDSKYWAGTDFRWSGDTAITSGRGGALTAYETHFPKARPLLTEQLAAEGKTVRGWVVLHSNSGKTVTVEPGPAGLPTLVAGENWLDEVLSWADRRPGDPRRRCHSGRALRHHEGCPGLQAVT